MGVDILRGRFAIKDEENRYNPMEIISESNMYEGFGDNMHQARFFFSVTEHCSLTNGKEFVDKETAIACINEHFDSLKIDGEVSDSYKGFPKTNRGFVNGFFRKEITKEDFEPYDDEPYRFEKYKLRSL